jgi:cytochrome c oxidase subunit 1
MINNKLGALHFWITIVASYGVFFPMHFLGLSGVPRRYYTWSEFPMFENMVDINELISIFAIAAMIGQLVFFFNFVYSAFRGPKAPMNPWDANTLEWTTPVEHFHGNWYGEIPTVYRWPYDYSKLDANGDFLYGKDFIPQTTPLGENDKDAGEH